MIEITLFSGPSCQLCDKARELIYGVLPYGSYALEVVDVTLSLEHKKAYGLRIPVLKNKANDEELEWPFDAEVLVNFLGDQLV